MYLGLSAYGGKFGFNAAAPAMPLIAAADRGTRGDGGAIVLVRARRTVRELGRENQLAAGIGVNQGGRANR
jgi:hypothetical protein